MDGAATFIVRRACPADAPAAVALLRRSITELCILDHRDEPATLAAWLANKTEERFLAWLADDDNHLVAADQAGALLGVGLLRRGGEINLCYLKPGEQRRGVGTAILTALEAKAREWGLSRLTLDSTLSARPFYERMGFLAVGEPIPGFGVSLRHPYVKVLEFDCAASPGMSSH